MAILTVESAAFSVLGTPPSQAVEEALARLVTQFRKPRIEGVLRAVASRIASVEGEIETLRTDRALSVAEGAQLDGLGRIVGLARGAMGDEEYRARLRVQIRINLADGTPENILGTLALLVPAGTAIDLEELHPAQLRAVFGGALPTDAGPVAADTLMATKPAGVAAWAEWTDQGADAFAFDGGADGAGFGDGALAHVVKG